MLQRTPRRFVRGDGLNLKSHTAHQERRAPWLGSASDTIVITAKTSGEEALDCRWETAPVRESAVAQTPGRDQALAERAPAPRVVKFFRATNRTLTGKMARAAGLSSHAARQERAGHQRRDEGWAMEDAVGITSRNSASPRRLSYQTWSELDALPRRCFDLRPSAGDQTCEA